MILSEIDSSIKLRKIEDLCDLPIIVYVNKFNEDSAKMFLSDMMKAEQNRQPIIPIMIDSYGGQVDALLSMVDAIKRSKKQVATIVTGKAMSCGALLFSCGHEGFRFMAPSSRLMIHDVSSITMGKVEDIKVDANELQRLNQFVYKMMARNCGQNETYFLDLVHEKCHADWYLTAEDAVCHKLANHIRVPEFKVKVSLDVQFK